MKKFNWLKQQCDFKIYRLEHNLESQSQKKKKRTAQLKKINDLSSVVIQVSMITMIHSNQIYSLGRRQKETKRNRPNSIRKWNFLLRDLATFEMLLYLRNMNYIDGARINQDPLAERSLNQCSSALIASIASLSRDFFIKILLHVVFCSTKWGIH